ncbi:hypothetical protein ABTZ59_02720 [Streptomyces sp. NPDC094034]|uniref:hypothetical protein n=1 Tax=Streptomyces sp. NPDC094034 TaxID=3155309 RepID=UPI003325D8EA
MVTLLKGDWHVDYEHVGPEYWANSDRENAEEVGSKFVNALRRVGVDFDSIGIETPCGNCEQPDYRISLGWISLDEASQMTNTVNAALDELNQYRRARRVLGGHPE